LSLLSYPAGKARVCEPEIQQRSEHIRFFLLQDRGMTIRYALDRRSGYGYVVAGFDQLLESLARG
jgi:hypothetical protein